MTVIPLLYFTFLAAYFYYKNRGWGMDVAASSLLIAISVAAVMIDINDIYGEYGINEYAITLPTVLLYCLQWTLVLIPIHHLSRLPLEKHFPVKQTMLYLYMVIIVVSSFIIILSKVSDIRDALLMDMIDVRHEHYKDLVEGEGGQANPLLIIPTIFISTPFPTLALCFWFYTKAFTKFSIFLRTGILIASIVQAITAIIVAGRSAIVFWLFDFYILYSLFYRYLSKKAKHRINMAALVMVSIIGVLFMAITISRFDEAGSKSTPFDSLYGYAGQHVNNFCTMFVNGSNPEPLYDRIFPFTSRLMGHPYDMVEHYDTLRKHTDVLVNVFDTFGGEIFLDLGWIAYILFFFGWIVLTLYVRYNWQEISFYRIFPLVIIIAFFTRGLFAWPFTGHVTSMALVLVFMNTYLFRYAFKI